MRPIEQWTLANGLRVLYQQDAAFPLASATLLLTTGSSNEKSPEAGLSSMTIDLLMQGTRKRSARAIARVLEAVGASMGTQAQVFKEKAHVLASLESRRDAIFNLAYDHFSKALYGNHPYGRPMEGDVNAVRRFKRKDFQRWHRNEIRPERGILSLITPLSANTARTLLQKSLNRWRPAIIPPQPRPFSSVAPLKKSCSRTIPSSFAQAYLMVGWQAPGAKHEDHIPLKVLNTLLGGGMSSRLFLTLREDLGLAYEVSSFYPTRLDTSQYVVYLGLPQEKLKLASRKLWEVLETLADRGPSNPELLQSKAMIRGAFLMDRQSHRRQAWYRAWWEFLRRGPGYGEEFLAAVDAVSAESVQRVIRGIIAQPSVEVTVVPK